MTENSIDDTIGNVENPGLEFKLDFRKWRCGSNLVHEHRLGHGTTKLLNSYAEEPESPHNMCCLGLILEQAGCPRRILSGASTVTDAWRRYTPEPWSSSDNADLALTFKKLLDTRTALQERATQTNDRGFTPVVERMEQLQSLFRKAGIFVEFVNVPEELLARDKPV